MLIAGIILLVLGVLGLIGASVYVFLKRRKLSKEQNNPKAICKDVGIFHSLPTAMIIAGLILICLRGCGSGSSGIKSLTAYDGKTPISQLSLSDGGSLDKNLKLKAELKNSAEDLEKYKEKFESVIDENERVVAFYYLELVKVEKGQETPVEASEVAEGSTFDLSLKIAPEAQNKDFYLVQYYTDYNIRTYSKDSFKVENDKVSLKVKHLSVIGFVIDKNHEDQHFDVTWYNYDDSVLAVETYGWNAMPVYKGETPTKPDSGESSFVFSNWEPALVPVTANASYKAVFEETVRTYTLTIVNADADKGVVYSGPASGTKFHFGDQIDLSCSGIINGLFPNWSRSDSVVSSLANYSFTMPKQDLTVTLSMKAYARNDNIITFGQFPQDKVTNAELKTTLNGLLQGALPTSSVPGSWTDMEFAINNTIGHYTWFQDVTYEGKKYRAVYFDQYAPEACYDATHPEEAAAYQYKMGYAKNTIHWFSFEYLDWYLWYLDDGGTNARLFCRNGVMPMHWYHSDVARIIDGKSTPIGDYAHSEIRTWLNGEFYDTSFPLTQQKGIINSTEWNNGNYYGDYKCDNTTDYMTLPSNYCEDREGSNYHLMSDACRITQKVTDYTKCMGIENKSYIYNWYYRNAAGPSGEEIGKQEATPGSEREDNYAGYVSYTTEGVVRPSCWITL